MLALDLFTAAVALAATEAAKKLGGKVAESTWVKIKTLWRIAFGDEPRAENLPKHLPERERDKLTDLFLQTEAVIRRSSALRRAQLVHRVLKGAHVLWVDDQPENNAYECRILQALGISVARSTSTKGALAKAQTGKYDVILSDIKRSHSNSGLRLLDRLREAGCTTEVIFYVGRVDNGQPTPPGAFGITDQPEPLLHFVFDVLERKRV